MNKQIGRSKLNAIRFQAGEILLEGECIDEKQTNFSCLLHLRMKDVITNNLYQKMPPCADPSPFYVNVN